MAGTQPYSIRRAGAYPFADGEPGSLVALAGIRGIAQSTAVTEYENKGDGGVLSSGADLDGLDLTITSATFTPVSVAAIAGGEVTTGGVAPLAETSYTRNKDDVIAPYKLVGQTMAKDEDGGMARVTYYKAQWRGGPDFGLNIDAFAEVTVNARATPNVDGDFFTYHIFGSWTELA